MQIEEFYLSPGDQIEISVYKYAELRRTIRIPGDGIIYYPMVGEINTTNMSVRELQKRITEGLSQDQKQYLNSGDEILISVFLHDEYRRRFIIPSDGIIFFPNVGEINITLLTLNEIRKIITNGLKNHVVDPQVIIDIIKLNNPQRINNPQVSIEVKSFNGQKVTILGEVKVPGIYNLHYDRITILDLIAKARGFSNNAKKSKIIILRKKETGKDIDIFTYSFRKYLQNNKFDSTTIIRKGDLVYVHKSNIVNVDRFLKHLVNIITPFNIIGNSIWLGQNIIDRTEKTVD
jgi:polysaccharide export outer membrane protein